MAFRHVYDQQHARQRQQRRAQLHFVGLCMQQVAVAAQIQTLQTTVFTNSFERHQNLNPLHLDAAIRANLLVKLRRMKEKAARQVELHQRAQVWRNTEQR